MLGLKCRSLSKPFGINCVMRVSVCLCLMLGFCVASASSSSSSSSASSRKETVCGLAHEQGHLSTSSCEILRDTWDQNCASESRSSSSNTDKEDCCDLLRRRHEDCREQSDTIAAASFAQKTAQVPRGGSVRTARYEDNEESEDEGEGVDFESIAFVLKLACEMNRELHVGNGATGGHTEEIASDMTSGVHIHPSQTWQPPISPPSPNTDTSNEATTLFHAARPSSQSTNAKLRIRYRGTSRWGPEVTSYLRRLQRLLKCPPVTFAVALVYLDRACSVETPRPLGVRSCPHLLPRTLHRLLLTALVIADRVLGTSSTQSLSRLGNSGAFEGMDDATASHTLEAMERYMLAALGTEGTWIDPSRFHTLSRVWNAGAFAEALPSSSQGPHTNPFSGEPTTVSQRQRRRMVDNNESTNTHSSHRREQSTSPMVEHEQHYEEDLTYTRPDTGERVHYHRREDHVVRSGGLSSSSSSSSMFSQSPQFPSQDSANSESGWHSRSYSTTPQHQQQQPQQRDYGYSWSSSSDDTWGAS